MVDLPNDFVDLCKSVTAKRPKTVIEHILKHGHITSEELKNIYNYDHPPRAVRDVRENGIPIKTEYTKGSGGRRIASYIFDLDSFKNGGVQKREGRTVLSKKIKDSLIKKYGSKCFIYLEPMDESQLQIDHRIPFEVKGDDSTKENNVDDFMLLSPSANRAKSWSCEHCANWQGEKNLEICTSCYWAYPENYEHVAMCPVRKISLLWQGEEIGVYEKLKKEASSQGKELPSYVKDVLKRAIKL